MVTQHRKNTALQKMKLKHKELNPTRNSDQELKPPSIQHSQILIASQPEESKVIESFTNSHLMGELKGQYFVLKEKTFDCLVEAIQYCDQQIHNLYQAKEELNKPGGEDQD